MTPLSGNRAIKPRRALAKSVLFDHGGEAVDFLLNSRVDGDAGLESIDVCARAIVAAKTKAKAVTLNVVKMPGKDCRLKRLACANGALLYLALTQHRLLSQQARQLRWSNNRQRKRMPLINA
jgi:hypothetical protein